MACDQPQKMSIGDHPMDVKIEEPLQDVVVAVPHTKPFDKEAFKKAFLMPQLNSNKKKKLAPKEKRSTVITSEAWRQSEQKKLEEKQRLEAAKVARKLEREEKKIIAAQVKVEKEIARESKKIEKARKDADKKLKKVGQKKILKE